jgi:hypothetical protein
MDNKRKYKRLIRSFEIEYYANGQAYKGISRDLSVTGLFIETDNFLDSDSIVDILIYLPNGLTSKLRGRIRRILQKSFSGKITATSKQGMGVEIIEQDLNYSRFITSMYVEHTLSLRTNS